MSSALADLCLCFSDVVVLPGVSVTGGDLTVVEGHDVTLPCKMTEQEKRLTQISWRRKTRGMPGNPFFFAIAEENSPKFVDGPDPRISFIGNFAERDGTLQISNVSLNDEGSYTCIFSLFPSGIYSTEIPLRVEVFCGEEIPCPDGGLELFLSLVLSVGMSCHGPSDEPLNC
uniref:Ig-like domain-containing protein n=1 Tax=Salarias fasciatus TaxID=181472 RepID=A0A672FUD0_SALFA